MTDKLQQTIKEELAKLPQENQNAINALDWVKITEEIGKKNLLTESEINDLQVETLLIMVDLEDPKAYANNIENNIDTSKEEAEKIAGEVTEKIFIPINNILVEIIKKRIKVKNPNHEQNLNFILSGGDYSSFMEIPPTLDKEGAGGGNPIQSPPRSDLGRSTPPSKGGEGTNLMNDIKSKFTI